MSLLKRLIPVLMAALFPGWTCLADSDMELWLLEDWEQKAASVNEGELELQQWQDANNDEHLHRSVLQISPDSLETGWVSMYQCHTNIDATSAIQIVFKEHNTRDLRIESSSHIERAWVEGHTVQLENVSRDSSLCLKLSTRALQSRGQTYVLENGPFMRRFLDGYYPMRVSMQVKYPGGLLRYIAASPRGLLVQQDEAGSSIEIKARFEGRLTTAVTFNRR